MLTGAALYPGEVGRLADDTHARCPAVALREAWCDEVRDVWSYIADGRSLTDVEPSPSRALLEAVVVVAGELRELSARHAKDAERDGGL